MAVALNFILAQSAQSIAASDPFADLRAIITEILSLLMQICALLLALAIASGFVEAQMGYIVGRPSLVSEVCFKVGAVVLCLAIALTAIPISNALVDLLF